MMTTITGLLFGALAGFIATTLMNEKSGWIKNIVLGVAGGFVGGYAFKLIGISANGQFGSLITSVAGACICIWVGRKLF
ncbi:MULTISPECIES: GlsB/YeaQ/YmgE family stress response membrane protein [Pseudobutyrivibrio]|uniref:Uncharacterized membrane protein YeaQ/YmgE, transglycosylase-associated protein family n=1 Tax=Pseudobutyrivibrio xylanivorans TaxID=185007 RepID=A0A1G5RXX3_PSEXY|nr:MULTISPECIES: GlsB/YeaQ/YmgE family stress response membrane protein [Pseudobutyrivibrio]MDC7279253.1 GlsB/YeaQ/YmgE family stress response membrane protein [Butyrivibrio fibrisolvens]SCZ78985.1 Uncharacterized membrane protein YeaQ/YmgE, transglycosylase-associated protein family [Pseudobutyrivibrio xylanivorans]